MNSKQPVERVLPPVSFESEPTIGIARTSLPKKSRAPIGSQEGPLAPALESSLASIHPLIRLSYKLQTESELELPADQFVVWRKPAGFIGDERSYDRSDVELKL